MEKEGTLPNIHKTSLNLENMTLQLNQLLNPSLHLDDMGHYPIRIRRSNIVKNHVSPNQNTNILFDVF